MEATLVGVYLLDQWFNDGSFPCLCEFSFLVRERFTNSVISGRMCGTSFLHTMNGIGSKSQCFVGISMIMDSISSEDMGLNDSNGGTSLVYGEYLGYCSKLSLIFFIFSRKNVANSSANYSSLSLLGIGL